ncbi:MAG: oxidoreductase [Bacillota bacterium]|nr:MAG: oxidoreductase [Bacillota bacterium]
MKIAVISGASSGLGREFALQCKKYFPEIGEYWLIARRKEKIDAYAGELKGITVRVLPYDLAKDESYAALAREYAERKPEIALLVNNAGLGYWGAVEQLPVEKQINSVDVNVKALSAVTAVSLPYMGAGARIVFVSSIASFVPNAYMTVYSATKAYVTSYARALRYELKGKKIGVTVVCPGPMDTEFIAAGGVKSKTFEKLPYCNVKKVVSGTLKAAKRGKFIYTNKAFYKFYRVLAKILPAAWLVPAAKT